ncbi:two-component system, NtrC family, response regulator [Pseudoalteromonas ulvae UL12]|uniref:Sigma-54-dependent Fis family transcriptional regulator n=1 Tax=Pseudoalteromonas ulvae TaxID=107327 RepID=A0A244CKL1_PSEDV|nr:sigma-54 dependent transcriptional regulator [Pseudoalteromonas ulvae]MBE0361931.1 two-component system, NtrC family, response regulator [Pseudoalteromonas ulvae UL12]OUL55886.1 sigma-54-dependent Fis family transcriptional regulator [Pseudoalteromonas ulvae]
MSTNTPILLVEDDHAQNELISAMLSAASYQVFSAFSVEDAIVLLKQHPHIQLVFTDWKLGQLSGLDLINYIRGNKLEHGIVVATAYGSIEHAVQAIEQGADDYLSKPFQRQELLLALAKANKANMLRLTNQQLNNQLTEQSSLVDIIGHAPCMQKVFQRIERVSATSATVLISGESGTGKELAARALHQLSHRNNRAFIAINCGAIPENLAEAELFGSVKGAFTGATHDKQGKFSAADQGTIFLDEIAELSLSLQTKLLRLLQEGVVTPIGANHEQKIDVRVIAASHKNLHQMVQDGEFREDLFYRLNVVPIHMPPLRERTEDIPRLIQHFLALFSQRYGISGLQLSGQLLKQLMQFNWPGNVRQLSNTLEQFVLLQNEDELLDTLIRQHTPTNNTTHFTLPSDGIEWDSFEKNLLQQALNREAGNKTQAAKLLGLNYKQFLYRLEKHAL